MGCQDFSFEKCLTFADDYFGAVYPSSGLGGFLPTPRHWGGGVAVNEWLSKSDLVWGLLWNGYAFFGGLLG